MSFGLFFVDKRCKLVRERHQIASSAYPRTLLPGNYSHLDKFDYTSFQTFYQCTQRRKEIVFEVIHPICMRDRTVKRKKQMNSWIELGDVIILKSIRLVGKVASPEFRNAKSIGNVERAAMESLVLLCLVSNSFLYLNNFIYGGDRLSNHSSFLYVLILIIFITFEQQ